jgi:hypothetical protein
MLRYTDDLGARADCVSLHGDATLGFYCLKDRLDPLRGLREQHKSTGRLHSRRSVNGLVCLVDRYCPLRAFLWVNVGSASVTSAVILHTGGVVPP